MKHLGDITKLSGYTLSPVDVITGGSPCQDLSVAGKRAGLAGERSGLFMEQIRLIKEMRENDKKFGRADDDIRPRFMVWENVCGAFSSNKGEDFRAVLEETARIADQDAVIPGPPKGKWQPSGCIMGNGWSIAWRVHDAQFWGVPQRRKRIALVADFGGERAPEILFERESVQGDIEAGGKEGEGIAAAVGNGIEKTGGTYDVRISSDGTKNWRAHAYETDVSRSLDTAEPNPDSNHGGICVLNDQGGKVMEVSNDVSGTLRAEMHGHEPCIVAGFDAYNQTSTGEVAKSLNSAASDADHVPCIVESAGFCPEESAKTRGIGYEKEVAPSLRAGNTPGAMVSYGFEPGAAKRLNTEGRFSEEVSPTLRAEMGDNQASVLCVDQGGGKSGANVTENVSPTLATTHGGEPVVYGLCSDGSNSMKSGNPHSGIYEAETTRTLDVGGGNPACNQGGMIVLEGNGSRPSHRGDGYSESEVSYTLNAVEQHAVCVENGKKQTVYDWHRQDTRMTELKDVCVTAAAGWGGGGNNMPYVMEEPILLESNQNHATIQTDGVSTALPASMGMRGGYIPMVCSDVAAPCNAQDGRGGVHSQMMDDPEGNFVLDSEPFTSSKDSHHTRFHDDGIAETLVQYSRGPGAVASIVQNVPVVRRLTPLECARLQGYPDGWVDIGDWVDSKGKLHKDADSPKYKALGNSIALPFWEWMAKRMRPYIASERPKMASLFDGIGGFPLVYSRAGFTPEWASEIEEFPMAVTKIRFPEEN